MYKDWYIKDTGVFLYNGHAPEGKNFIYAFYHDYWRMNKKFFDRLNIQCSEDSFSCYSTATIPVNMISDKPYDSELMETLFS